MAVTNVAFRLQEIARPDAGVERLFRAKFRAPPPSHPRHFVAIHGWAATVAYVHYTVFEPGVFLCGGLCVDARIYRRLGREERSAIKAQGSLSRWLLAASIDALRPKRAVFAYTGDIRSRRDCQALGFVTAQGPYLIVQWHDEPEAARAALVARVHAAGPF